MYELELPSERLLKVNFLCKVCSQSITEYRRTRPKHYHAAFAHSN